MGDISKGPNDPYVLAIEHLRDAGEALGDAIQDATAQLETALKQRTEGAPLPLVQALVAAGGTNTRRRVVRAVARYEHAAMVYRVIGIRELVDEHGMSLSEVGSLIGVSRQMVSRLYKARD
jgi:DNA-binding transcriptional regulator LsrR (DeoR family)